MFVVGTLQALKWATRGAYPAAAAATADTVALLRLMRITPTVYKRAAVQQACRTLADQLEESGDRGTAATCRQG